ncbi:trypsin-like cysteine/serine peptidase domain-containing protein [Gongronella butleri]|nr:trypsin-like cysteine/serine peptidase domain-containing protein [Gongronella butleri]
MNDDDTQHPLTVTPDSSLYASPVPRGPVDSPAPKQAEQVRTNLQAHRDSLTEAVTHFEQFPSDMRHHQQKSQQHSPAWLRGRSKSLAYGVNFMGPNPEYISAVPYKAKTWEPTLEKAIKAIISIKASHVRSFDTETSGTYTATGFIVDAKQGILLTNRHVVSPAPIVAQAVLTNYEEVPLIPVYRDPVHDFGFMRFDPSKIKFMELEEIELSPERARVGLDIRVVGNDAGEKLSILAGTLARLDRRAPEYGVGEYNDFNTFYLQAASGTSGGSSGSPVLDIDGHAVALNAGGASRASSSYYLPLDRVKRALSYVQQGQTVPRGTLQAEFEYLPYNEVRRLGLKAPLEEKIRAKFPDETGMLVVRSVLPDGPADQRLIPGDILLGCNGNMVPHFIALFEVLDDSVGKDVVLTLCRGKKTMDVTVTVQDLHSITPDKFVEIGGGVVHDLSYQLAKGYSQPVRGVYVATSGHMLASASAWRKSIITSVNNIPTPNLDAFIQAMNTLPDGARVPLCFYALHKAYKEKVMIMHVDRHWHLFRLAVRNDVTGVWDYQRMPPPPSKLAYQPSTASFPPLAESLALAQTLMPSFVAIDFYLPYLVDGMKATQFYGMGYVVATGKYPLVLCDRDTIPISLGDIFITFANSIIIPGKLVLLHPFYNYALITYDPTLIGDTPAKPLVFSDVELKQGDNCTFVGLNNDHAPTQKNVTISSISNIGTRECSPPRWRAVNVEGISIDDPSLNNLHGGLLIDKDGKVQALWTSYSTQNEKAKDTSFMSGLAASLVVPTLDKLMSKIENAESLDDCQGLCLDFRGLDAEFWTMRLAAARTLGLSDAWVQRIEKSGASRFTLLYVLNLLDEHGPLAKQLQVGDVLLSIQGQLMTRLSDLTKVLSAATTTSSTTTTETAKSDDVGQVDMCILRKGQEIQVTVPLASFSGYETTRVIGWQGALIQCAYRAVLEQVRHNTQGVYVSCTLYGSPASNVLRPGVWITEVQGQRVQTLDQFLSVVHKNEFDAMRRRRPSYIPPVQRQDTRCVLELTDDKVLHEEDDQDDEDDNNDEGYIRLKTISRNGTVRVVALKLDLHYWNSWQLQRDPSALSGWNATEA